MIRLNGEFKNRKNRVHCSVCMDIEKKKQQTKQNKDDLMDARHNKHSRTLKPRLMRKRKRYNGYLISNNFFFH